jgi:hypothetical protein
MEINLSSIGPSVAGGIYSDNFHRLVKPTEVRRLNPITPARPGPTSTPTLSSVTAAAPSSNPYHLPTGFSTPPPPWLLHVPAILSPRCAAARAFHTHSLSLSNTGLTHTPPSPGRHLRPALPSPVPGCLPARHRPAGARPLHCFLGHQP